MGAESSGSYEHERHENSEPFKKKCGECREEFHLKAIFFPADWLYGDLVCGKCFEENIQHIIDEGGLGNFLKRWKTTTPEQERTLLSLTTKNEKQNANQKKSTNRKA